MFRNLSLVSLFLVSTLALALPSDDQKPLKIEADSTTFDYSTGAHSYEGNVKIIQGSTTLTADRVVTKNNDKHKMEEAVAYGFKHLAEYSTLPKEGDKILHAKAKTIKFYPATQMVVLEGDVMVTQGENSVNGQIIIYNMKNQTVTAPANKSGRATVVIEPNQLKSS